MACRICRGVPRTWGSNAFDAIITFMFFLLNMATMQFGVFAWTVRTTWRELIAMPFVS